MMRKSVVRHKGVVVLALLLVLLFASVMPAAAQSVYTDDWAAKTAPIGNCRNKQGKLVGITRGNFVRAIQTILNSALILPRSGIDGVWGPQSDAALREWQRRHRLTDDGCAGWRTLNAMQFGGDYVCPPRLGCYWTKHMEETGSAFGSFVFRWREPQSDPTHYAKFLWDSIKLCWWVNVGGNYIPMYNCPW
jgi:peptidoglycan hydrolase-like protein with peptidoglycan-binding domain